MAKKDKAAKAKPVGMNAKRKLFEGERIIAVELAQKEMAELATEMAKAHSDLRAIEDEAATARKEFNAQALAVRERIQRLARMAETGRGERTAKVIDTADFASGEVVTTIAGTTKVVATRPITAAERQGTLDFVGPEPPKPDDKPGKKPKVGRDGTIVGGPLDGAPLPPDDTAPETPADDSTQD